jgi:cell division protease FtsH
MNEVKSPKKPLVYYYAIVILVILALNFLAVPWLSQRQVKEVDYGTFMTMTENQEIGRVEVQNNQILFTNKDDTQVYKTGLMDDPDLIYRLKDSGAEFSSEIVEQMSPFLSFLLTWLAADRVFCRPRPVHAQAHDEQGRRAELHDVRARRLEREGLRQVGRGHQILRCRR